MKASNRATRRIFLDFVRLFNKYIFNRITLWLAKRGKGPYSIITHKGRQSERIYKTPVLATYIDEYIYIPLPYGDHVDWLLNVLKHDGCKILWKETEVTASDPEVMESEAAMSSLPEGRRDLFERFEVEKFLRLRRRIE